MIRSSLPLTMLLSRHTRRREFITLLGGAAAAWPLAARAQQAVSKMPRIGIIDPGAIWDHFRQGLRDLGYAEGRNIAIEHRSTEKTPDRLVATATELAQLPVDVIVSFGSEATQAAKQATTTIPIVMVAIGDPVRAGWRASPIRGEISLAIPSWQRLRPNGYSFSNWPFLQRRVWLFSGIPTIPRMPSTSTSGKLLHRRWAWRCCLSRFAAPTSSTAPSPR